MNWRSMPPLASLRAFSAFAKSGGVVEAGAALNVSHAAISQQLRALERFLGVALVDRSGRALTLTPQGLRLSQALELGFGAIATAVSELTDAETDRPLQISTTQLFATTWLMPRLTDFQIHHPRVNMMINPTPERMDPEPGGVDVAIRFGDGTWPGLEAELLVATDMVVTAAQSLVGNQPFASYCDLLKFPWLQELGTNETNDWLRDHGVIEGRVRSLTELPGNLLLESARAGQGVIITAKSIVAEDLSAGRLRVLFEDASDKGYYIVTRPGVLRDAAKSFVTWLRRQKTVS